VEREDEVLLLLREAAALEVGAEVVDPPEAAALAAALQTCANQSGVQPSTKRRAMAGGR
jgi:hypothetical protein